jgi:hypothetical protein
MMAILRIVWVTGSVFLLSGLAAWTMGLGNQQANRRTAQHLLFYQQGSDYRSGWFHQAVYALSFSEQIFKSNR